MSGTSTSGTSASEASSPAAAARPGVTRAPFGQLPDGRAAELYTLTNARGVEVRITTYGATITVLRTPDRTGRLDDIVLGYDDLAGYQSAGNPYFGTVVGRYGNRIANGRFTLDGTTYELARNNGPNALHGGLRGFDKRLWTATSFERADGVGVTMRYTSPAGEEGYPGTLVTQVTYTLTPDNRLVVDYEATTDRATPVNLTQHTYWNLAGTSTATGAGPLPTILDHRLTLGASNFTPVDSTLITTGQIAPVQGTPFDFRTPTAIGARIGQPDQQLKYGGGYDHNWVLDRNGRTGLVRAARLAEPTTGRVVEVSTAEPGIQFYSGNFLDGSIRGKGGRVYPYRSGLALETQHYPDSPNKPQFPSTILRPGETYRTQTVFAFSVER
jgi:aldose 1-epimerase